MVEWCCCWSCCQCVVAIHTTCPAAKQVGHRYTNSHGRSRCSQCSCFLLKQGCFFCKLAITGALFIVEHHQSRPPLNLASCPEENCVHQFMYMFVLSLPTIAKGGFFGVILHRSKGAACLVHIWLHCELLLLLLLAGRSLWLMHEQEKTGWC